MNLLANFSLYTNSMLQIEFSLKGELRNSTFALLINGSIKTQNDIVYAK
jgi:hypothetical protein